MQKQTCPNPFSVVVSMFITEGVYGRRRQGLDHKQPQHLQGVLHNQVETTSETFRLQLLTGGGGVPSPRFPHSCQYALNFPVHPLQTHCSRALQCQNSAAHPGESRWWGSMFRRRGAEPPSDVSVCGSAAQEKPLRVRQEGMRISRLHFLTRDEEHAVVVLEILCATPKPPCIPKPPPQPVPRRPQPPPASDHVTLTQYSRHRCSSLLPLAPAPKRPCPSPQLRSSLKWRASESAPPTAEAAIWVIAPYASPPAPTPDFGEIFQFPALRQVCTERLLHIGHSFIFNLTLEVRK